MALSILRSRILMVTSKQAQMASRNMLYSSSTTGIRNMTAVCALGVRNMTNSTKDELYRQVIVEVKGHDRAVLNSYEKFTTMAAQELGVHVERIYEPPRIFTRMSLLKSVFIHKKHFHQYEMRTLFRVFELKYLTGSTASTFLEYIQRNLPEGMAMKVTKHQLEKIPEHIKAPGPAAQPKKMVDSDQDNLSDSGKKSKSSAAVSSSSTETSTPSVSTSSPKYSSTSSSSSDTSSTSASKTDATSKDASRSESKKTKKSKSQHTSKNKTQD